jgi:hypothetical protein
MDVQATLFDAGEPVAVEPDEEPGRRPVSFREQLEFVWSTVMPLYPLESEWIHEPNCECLECREERCRLLDLRQLHYRRCEADKRAIAERVAEYAAIKARDMDAPLPFEVDEYEPQGDE